MLPVNDGDHARGPHDAQITIVQYGDYDCPHTRRSHAVLASLFASLGPVSGGRSSGVHSTPTFFFNGVLHDGHYDEPTLRERLERARPL